MREVVKRFTCVEGIVEIVKENHKDDPISWFDAIWVTEDFSMRLRLGDGSACTRNLRDTERWVNKWASNPLMFTEETIPNWPLYAWIESGIIKGHHLFEEGYFKTLVKAKDVPKGAYLTESAGNFFSYWKGKEAVKSHHLMV